MPSATGLHRRWAFLPQSRFKNTYEINVLDQRLFSSDRHFYDRLRFLLQEKPLYVGLSVYTGKMISLRWK